eukprot:GFUD01008829.1.p1 GENE.GFUD01008829.1~~GFUD01008829.1.p1  ORF type:complete len:155 (+),score=12.30 GFUD01008829.1:229-693(+)
MKALISFIIFLQAFTVRPKSFYGCGSTGCGNNFIPWNFNRAPSPTAGYPVYGNGCGPSGCGYQACGPQGCGSSYRSYNRPCAHSGCGMEQQPCGAYGTFMQKMQPQGMNPCGNNGGGTTPWDPNQIVGGNGRDCPRGFVWDRYRQRCVRVYGKK